MTMRADSRTGRVVALMSRRAPMFQPLPGEPANLAEAVHRSRERRKRARTAAHLADPDPDDTAAPTARHRPYQGPYATSPNVAPSGTIAADLRRRRAIVAAAVVAAMVGAFAAYAVPRGDRAATATYLPTTAGPAGQPTPSTISFLDAALLTSDDVSGYPQQSTPTSGATDLASLLLGSQDLTGFTPMPEGTPASGAAGCRAIDEPASPAHPAIASAAVMLSNPTTTESVTESLTQYAETADASGAVGQVAATGQQCRRFTMLLDGSQITASCRPLAVPSIGDQKTVASSCNFVEAGMPFTLSENILGVTDGPIAIIIGQAFTSFTQTDESLSQTAAIAGTAFAKVQAAASMLD